ncbi:MAG: HPr family phosphocarrier protein [Pirellulales bacterium]
MNEARATRTVVVNNPQGLHARPADLLVKLATRFESKIEIIKDYERVDAKSILAVMTLAATAGTRLSIEAVGPDAQESVDALAELLERNFGEDENMNQG